MDGLPPGERWRRARGSADRCRARLEERVRASQERVATGAAKAELEPGTIAKLSDVALLGGYAPERTIVIGDHYDLWFGDGKFVVFPRWGGTPLMEVRYTDIEDIEIGGPGVVKRGGGYVGGGFSAVGALEGMAIAGVLNALTTRTSIVTVVRIQAMTSELFLLHTKSTPDTLRMELSRALGAIRAVSNSPSAPVRRPASRQGGWTERLAWTCSARLTPTGIHWPTASMSAPARAASDAWPIICAASSSTSSTTDRPRQVPACSASRSARPRATARTSAIATSSPHGYGPDSGMWRPVTPLTSARIRRSRSRSLPPERSRPRTISAL